MTPSNSHARLILLASVCGILNVIATKGSLDSLGLPTDLLFVAVEVDVVGGFDCVVELLVSASEAGMEEGVIWVV